MGVYINGMEMPSSGTYEASIDVTNSNGKTAISVYLRDENDSRRFSVGVYEAFHVPPHGRLIDERKTGEWCADYDGYSDGEPVYDMWWCSECGTYFDEWDDKPTWKYCPNCGAYMRKEGTQCLIK